VLLAVVTIDKERGAYSKLQQTKSKKQANFGLFSGGEVGEVRSTVPLD
jgi:hypothetical protein